MTENDDAPGVVNIRDYLAGVRDAVDNGPCAFTQAHNKLHGPTTDQCAKLPPTVDPITFFGNALRHDQDAWLDFALWMAIAFLCGLTAGVLLTHFWLIPR